MLAKTPLIDLVLDWVGRQNPEQTYNWSDTTKCACAQMSSALGCEDDWYRRPIDSPWTKLNEIARGPLTKDGSIDTTHHTFGRFHERLKSGAISFM